MSLIENFDECKTERAINYIDMAYIKEIHYEIFEIDDDLKRLLLYTN